MTRKVQKADKLVNSATSIFGKALAKVMKANDLINAHIEAQLSLNDQDQVKIEVEYKKITFNEALSYPYSIPDGYSLIKID